MLNDSIAPLFQKKLFYNEEDSANEDDDYEDFQREKIEK